MNEITAESMLTRLTRAERALGYIAPGWLARRIDVRRSAVQLAAAQRKAYDAAERNRLAMDWITLNLSADQAILPNESVIRARARQAARTTSSGSSIVKAYKRHIIGTGITCRSAATDPRTGQVLEAFRKRIDDIWSEWSESPEICDIERRKTDIEMQRQSIGEFAVVGQALTVMSYLKRDSTLPGLVLQNVEVEQLDGSKLKNNATGNAVVGGIEVDAYSAALIYWLYLDCHPLEQYRMKSEGIPADRVIDFFEQDRPRQVRAVSRMATVLGRMRNYEIYETYVIVAARLQATVTGAIVEYGDGAAENLGLPPLSGDSATDAHGSEKMILEQGMLNRVSLAGEGDVKFYTPTQPGAQFNQFSEVQLQQIAAGAGLDYPTLVRDYTKGSFSSQRQSQIVLNQETDPLLELFMGLRQRRVYRRFVTLSVTEGLVSAPGFHSDPAMRRAYLRVDMQGPAKPWIDPANMMAAYKLALDYRLISRQRILNEMGEGFVQLMDQLGFETRYADGQGVTLPENLPDDKRPAISPKEPRPRGADPVGNSGGNGHVTPAVRQVFEQSFGRELASMVLDGGDR